MAGTDRTDRGVIRFMSTRTETDHLGSREVPGEAYWGIHTQRAAENFRLSGLPMPPDLVHAIALVKKAACLTNLELGLIPKPVGEAILGACDDLLAGALDGEFPLDAVQGGAGTSANMNVNEVLANRALERLGHAKGRYDLVHPIEHVNLHQSTNDVYPTAVRVAVIGRLREASCEIERLQRAFQKKETEFSRVMKTGRTEWQAAVPMTLGAEFGAFAEAFARDRWRTAKCEERLRVVNLGGTAIGTGLTAPKSYVFRVTDRLRELSGIGLSRAENGVDATANADAFAEVAGILGACTGNLIKVSCDLRMLHFLGEIRLPSVQTGSSIMPGKVNPVILEAVISAALRMRAEESVVVQAVSMGTLQINEFLPMIALGLLSGLGLCARAADTLARHVEGIEADPEACARYLENNPALLTVLLPRIGYDRVGELAREFALAGGTGLRAFLAERIGEDETRRLFAAETLLLPDTPGKEPLR
jgi:aspartate ammonia-lyase